MIAQLHYETKTTFDIDDRDLAHLRVVVMNKLRRGESFMLQLPDPGQGCRSVWLHPGVPLVFHFYGGHAPRLDHVVIDEWMAQASGPDGLFLTSRR